MWTNEQQRAIETKGGNILVSAAAGSGKTAVLTERIVRLVSDEKNGVGIDKLLVVTFTNAAAGEMRERVLSKLTEASENNAADKYLKKQIALLPSADIMTIHAFCLKVIRENCARLGLDPSFRIGNEAEVSLLESETLDSLFEDMYASENNEGFLSLVESYASPTSDSALKELVLNVYDFAESNTFPEKWLDDALDLLNVENGIRGTVWESLLLESIKKNLDRADELIEQILKNYSIPEYKSALDTDNAIIKRAYKLVEKKDIDGLCEMFSQLKFATLGRKGEKSDAIGREEVKKIRKELKDELSDIKKNLFFKSVGELENDMKALYPVIGALCGIVKEFKLRFSQAKREHNIVDFGDIEHFCIAVLYDETEDGGFQLSESAYMLSEKYFEVLTDEYQDTNDVQEAVLSAVSGRSCGNRFMVGDIKQSIYRFRLARPELFMDKYDRYRKNGGGSLINLASNFRSLPNVLESVNFLFSQIMSREAGEIDYDASAALYPVREAPEGGFETELDLIELSSEQMAEDEAEFEEDEDELENIEVEAAFIAGRINEMIRSKELIHDKNGSMRPVKYSDIAVLMRSPGRFSNQILDIFSESGIPAYSETVSGFFETEEITTAVDFLEVIDNPRQDIPLLGVMRSPVYGFNACDFAEIKTSCGEEYFFDKAVFYSENGEDKQLAERLKAFTADIAAWRDASPQLAIDELLRDIYAKTGYYDYIGARPDGSVRQANLEILLDKAKEYEGTSFRGLFTFVRYVEKIKQGNSDMGLAKLLSDKAELVQIMSVHKSKGLEFPVVFAAGLGKQFNKRGLYAPVLFHKSLGFGARYVDYENRVSYNTLARAVISRKIWNENLAEEMRILYVALTRAREKLILVGAKRNIHSALKKWLHMGNTAKTAISPACVSSANCFFDWIVPAVSRHRSASFLWETAEIRRRDDIAGIYDHPSRWKMKIIPREDAAGVPKEIKAAAESLNTEIENWDMEADFSGNKQKIKEAFLWRYPYESSSKIPSSISISEIKRMHYEHRIEQGESLPPYRSSFKKPEFLQKEKGLSGAEKGTAFHTVMERLDFKKEYSLSDIENEISNCLKIELLTEEEAKSINASDILGFFGSNVGKRIKKSSAVFKELPFAIEMKACEIYPKEEYADKNEGVLIHGIIDCFFYENDEIVIVDYKTDIVPKGTEKEMAMRYKLQLDMYTLAAERVSGKRVKERIVYLFKSGEKEKGFSI